MKFTKEQAVEKLNQELTNGGKKPLRMSERTLESQVETLLTFVSDEEMELDAFVEKVKASLSSINSNMEKDQSDFIKDYQKTHPQTTTPSNEGSGDGAGKGGDDPNAELLRRLDELERKASARELEETISTKRAEIKKYLKDNNVENEEWIDSMLKMVTVSKDDDSTAKGKDLLELYNKTQTGNPITPGSPKPGGGIDAEHAFDDVKKVIKARSGQVSDPN